MSDNNDPVRGHLAAAENYLAIAEDGFIKQYEDPGAEDGTLPGLYGKTKFALQLAEQHRELAGTISGLIPQRYAIPQDTATEAVRAAMAADVEREQAIVLDQHSPEPDSTPGDLWIDANAPAPQRFRYLYRLGKHDWCWCTDHAYALSIERSHDVGWATALDGGYEVRRPTEEERVAFYAPPADDTPEPEATCDCCVSGLVAGRGETCDDCGHGPEKHANGGVIPVRHVQAAPPAIRLGDFTNPQGTSLADLDDKELERLINAITDECRRRERENGTEWRSPGGAGQWHG